MPKKSSEEVQQGELYSEKQGHEELYAKPCPGNLAADSSAADSAPSPATARKYTNAERRGFASWNKYLGHLAGKRGYASYHAYRKQLVKDKGFESFNRYQEQLARDQGFASRREYEDSLVLRRGFASRSQYEEHLAQKRQQLPVTQKFCRIVKGRLRKLRKTQRWLAEELGVSEGTVSRYVSGRMAPKGIRQKRLFGILRLPHQTLEELLE